MNSPFDRILNEIQNEPIDTVEAKAASGRVWQNLVAELQNEAKGPKPIERIRSCSDFQALMPDFRAGTLSAAKSLLMRDHLRECSACRKALQGAPIEIPVVKKIESKPGTFRMYAIAASVLVAIGFVSYFVRDRYFSQPAGPRATVESIQGGLYRVAGNGFVSLRAGDALADREVIRASSGGTGLVRLRDGSVVELGERSELSVTAQGSDTTIRLEQGSIIVQAAKRRTGHLYVVANDCRVAVTGTIFSVNRGTKGSRVSVVEGEVQVARGKDVSVLHRGDQISTHESMAAVPIRDEIAWSRNVDSYLALLKELAELKVKLQNIPTPGLRYRSRLLGALPENTAVVASVPNLAESLAQAHQILEQQAKGSPVLKQWWDRHGMDRTREMVTKMRSLGAYLGDEIILAFPARSESPVFLAEVIRPGLRELVQKETSGLPIPIKILVLEKFVVAGENAAELSRIGSYLEQPGTSPFLKTAFHKRLSDTYRDGAGFVFGADLERLGPNLVAPMQQIGVSNLRHIIAERKEVAGTVQNSAALTFSGARGGIASWLGAPGPMGTLNFVSPDAQLASSFIVKNPSLLVEDVLRMFDGAGGTFKEIEDKTGVRLKEDLAASLGGEVTFALDGPVLPVPSWKAVLEVNDAPRLQRALTAIVAEVNRVMRAEGKKGISLAEEWSSGRAFYAVRSLDYPQLPEVHYTFADGYFLASANRGLLMKAMSTRQSGTYLSRSAGFLSLLPRDRHANFSAVLYQNMGLMVGPLAQTAAGLKGLSQEQAASLRSAAKGFEPTLLCAYGDPDRILVAGNGDLLGFGLNGLAGPAGLIGVIDQNGVLEQLRTNRPNGSSR